jgi:hypothetical protein
MLREKWLAAAIGILMASFAQTDASAADVYCVTLVNTQPVNGVPVKVPIRFYRTDDKPCFPISTPSSFKAVANLSELQRQTPQIMARIPLPQDNCATYGLNNVLTLSDPRLLAPSPWPIFHTFFGGYDSRPVVTRLQTNGTAVVWECAKNPVPKVTLVWEPRPYKLFGKTYYRLVPVTHTSERPPIKVILATQPFIYYQALTLRRASADSVEIVLGMKHVNLDGNIWAVMFITLDAVFAAFNFELNLAAPKFLSPKNFFVDLRSSLQALGLTIYDAKFVELSPPDGQKGDLGAELLLSK